MVYAKTRRGLGRGSVRSPPPDPMLTFLFSLLPFVDDEHHLSSSFFHPSLPTYPPGRFDDRPHHQPDFPLPRCPSKDAWTRSHHGPHQDTPNVKVSSAVSAMFVAKRSQLTAPPEQPRTSLAAALAHDQPPTDTPYPRACKPRDRAHRRSSPITGQSSLPPSNTHPRFQSRSRSRTLTLARGQACAGPV